MTDLRLSTGSAIIADYSGATKAGEYWHCWRPSVAIAGQRCSAVESAARPVANSAAGVSERVRPVAPPAGAGGRPWSRLGSRAVAAVAAKFDLRRHCLRQCSAAHLVHQLPWRLMTQFLHHLLPDHC